MQKVIGLLVILLVLAVGAIGLVKFDIIEIGFLSSILKEDDVKSEEETYFNKKIAIEAKRGVKKKDIEKIAKENNATNIYYRSDIDVYELEFSQNISYTEFQHILGRIEENSKVETVTVVENEEQNKSSEKESDNQIKEELDKPSEEESDNQSEEELDKPSEKEPDNQSEEELDKPSEESSNNPSTNDKMIENLSEDDDYIYYKSAEEICKVDKELTETEVIKDTDIVEDVRIDNDCIVYGDWIYCVYNTYMGSDNDWQYIYRVKKNGEDGELLTRGYNPVIYDDSIYYVKVTFNDNLSEDDESRYEPMEVLGIYKMSLDGKNDTCVVEIEGGYEPTFTIANSKIYYADGGDIGCMSIDGSGYKTLATCTEAIDSKLYLDYGYLYFSTYDGGIYSLDLSSNTVTKLVKNAYIHSGHNGVIYYSIDNSDYNYGDEGFTVYYKNDLYKMDMKTQEQTKLIAVDGKILYLKIVDDKILVHYLQLSEEYFEGTMPDNTKISIFDLDEQTETLLDKYNKHDA